jgi:hypothetical protein
MKEAHNKYLHAPDGSILSPSNQPLLPPNTSFQWKSHQNASDTGWNPALCSFQPDLNGEECAVSQSLSLDERARQCSTSAALAGATAEVVLPPVRNWLPPTNSDDESSVVSITPPLSFSTDSHHPKQWTPWGMPGGLTAAPGSVLVPENGSRDEGRNSCLNPQWEGPCSLPASSYTYVMCYCSHICSLSVLQYQILCRIMRSARAFFSENRAA